MIKKYELELDDRKKCGGTDRQTDFWKKRLVRQKKCIFEWKRQHDNSRKHMIM
jgi:hypothetical protein